MYDSVGFLFTSDSAIYAYSGALDDTPYIGVINEVLTIQYNEPGVFPIRSTEGPTAPKQRWISSF